MIQLLIALALAVAPHERPSEDPRFYTFIVDPAVTPITLAYERPSGDRYGSLGAVADDAAQRNQRLIFATNAGMYHPDRRPVGLFVERGQTRAKLVRGASSGNFGWKPNGVFLIRKNNRADVVTTEDYTSRDVVWATQSGPMLLIAGALHEGFVPDSRHTNIRNGVGILPDGRVAFVMSKVRVTFHALAQHFADLGCKDALYFDGSVSRTYWPDGGISDRGGDFGVIVALHSASTSTSPSTKAAN